MNEFVGYEYQDVTVKKEMAALFTDSYENFGWQLEATAAPIGKPDSVLMKFKRDRHLRNKVEITRLQRQFDASAAEINSLGQSKYLKASAVAYAVGLIGTAFMAGSVFAVTAGHILPCILLAVPAFAGWILPYLLYRTICRKKTAQITPLIDKKYDELYELCEKANALLA